jgi:hypothetical protein
MERDAVNISRAQVPTSKMGLYGLQDAQNFRPKSTATSGPQVFSRAASPEPPRDVNSREATRFISVKYPDLAISGVYGLDVGSLTRKELKMENSRLKRENQLLETLSQGQSSSRAMSRSTTPISLRKDLYAEKEWLQRENKTLLVPIGEENSETASVHSISMGATPSKPPSQGFSWALRSHNKPASYIHHLNRTYLVGTGILVAKTKTPAGFDSAALSSSLSSTGALSGDPQAAVRFSLGQRRSDGWGVVQPATRTPAGRAQRVGATPGR